MKKILLAIFATLAMASAFADPTNVERVTSIDVSQLSPEQKAELLANVTKLKQDTSASAPNISAIARDEATKWGELGANMGKAAVGAAKEIGVAANDFVATPLGKITMGIVIYKILGKEVMHFITGGAVLVFFLSMAIFFVRRKGISSAEYDYKPTLFGLYNKKVMTSYKADDSWNVVYIISAAVCAAMGLLIGLNVMF